LSSTLIAPHKQEPLYINKSFILFPSKEVPNF